MTSVLINLSQAMSAIIDEADLPSVAKHRWSARRRGDGKFAAVRSLPGRRSQYMHRFILGVEDRRLFVDHINGNPLDNRRENIRVCTCAENNRNHNGANRNSKSGHLGVLWARKHAKWQAYISLNNKHRHLGLFARIEDAIAARAKAEIEMFGHFAPTRKAHGDHR